MKKKFALYAALLALGLGLLTGARAQTSTVGSISGTVRDPQGAAVPKAEVTIEEETTGQTRTVTQRRRRHLLGAEPARRPLQRERRPAGLQEDGRHRGRGARRATGWSSTSTSKSARSARR